MSAETERTPAQQLSDELADQELAEQFAEWDRLTPEQKASAFERAERERRLATKLWRRSERRAIYRPLALYAAISAAVTGAVFWWLTSDWLLLAFVFPHVMLFAWLGHQLWSRGGPSRGEWRDMGKTTLLMLPFLVGVGVFEAHVYRLGLSFFAALAAYFGLLWLIWVWASM